MKINFDDSAEPVAMAPPPPGKYRCRLEFAEEEWSQSGQPFWRLSWLVLDGTHRGLHIVDRLYFSSKALPRVKILFACLGLETEGTVDLEPQDLAGRKCIVEAEADQYSDAQGNVRHGVRVPFRGYAPIDEDTLPATGPKPIEKDEEPGDRDDDLPF